MNLKSGESVYKGSTFPTAATAKEVITFYAANGAAVEKTVTANDTFSTNITKDVN